MPNLKTLPVLGRALWSSTQVESPQCSRSPLRIRTPGVALTPTCPRPNPSEPVGISLPSPLWMDHFPSEAIQRLGKRQQGLGAGHTSPPPPPPLRRELTAGMLRCQATVLQRLSPPPPRPHLGREPPPSTRPVRPPPPPPPHTSSLPSPARSPGQPRQGLWKPRSACLRLCAGVGELTRRVP